MTTAVLTITSPTVSTQYFNVQPIVVQNSSMVQVTLSASGNATTLQLTPSTLTLLGGTPTSASSTGVTGQIEWDAGYIYICTATNTWKRAAISSW